MAKNTILQKNYTLNQSGYQLKLPLNLEVLIPENDSVRLLSQFVEELELSDLYSTYERIPENPSPRCLLKITLYSYMNHDFSSRTMERNCRRDVNFMYLLEGSPVPDHSTFARFRALHFGLCSQRILSETTEFLHRIGEISGKTLFIDGTKIEASANKYTFVWKKAVTKNLSRLLDRLAAFVQECEERYGIKLIYQNQVKMKHIKKLKRELYAIKETEGIDFVHGKGKRKSPLQKSIETLEGYLERFKEYTRKLEICGERNSYSKTDHDATFMRMKEDAMGNGQLKAGYNVQHGVDSEYITWLSIGPQPSDTTTLIPFLKEMEQNLSFQYEKVISDAGYESEENYHYLKEKGQSSFIKPVNYETARTRKYRQDIGRMENMEYDETSDTYTCKNGKKLTVDYIRKQTTKSGYGRETTIYTCADCGGCPYKRQCIKGNNSKKPLEERNKNLQVSKRFKEYREENWERITSEEGRRLRMNRSIQAESSFGELKQDAGFRRFLCRGTRKVQAEITLLAIAHNIKKLHHKIQDDRTGTHLFPLKENA